jgi:hydrophobic/amphiphilic exporter-1 (mainly G- bacteria), HAE1 family
MRARRSQGGPSSQPVQVRVFGDDLDELTQTATTAESALAELPQLADISNSLTAAREITIRPDPTRLMDLGLSAQQIGTTVRVAYQGAVVGKWAEPSGKERDVRVQLPTEIRNRPEALGNLPILRRGTQLITLRQVASEASELKPTRITRVDRQRVATIGAEPSGVPLGEATERVTATMDALELPAGTRWALDGTSEEQQSSFGLLLIGLGLSIVLMYMVLTVLYESWLQPLLILTALPLATVGAFLGLLAFNQTLSIPSFIGLIALFGLVGKNAILLVDRANDLRREGLDRTSALEQAGPSRLRPILMTSAVLILSMLPVAMQLGDGGAGRAPLGAVLVGGMTTSTFLSLLYVPVAYTYFDSFGTLLGRLFHWRPRVPFRRRPRGAAVPAPTPARRAAAPLRGAAPPLPAVGGVGSRGGLIAVTRRPPDWRAPRWQPRSIRQNPADGHAEAAAPSGEPAVLRRAG